MIYTEILDHKPAAVVLERLPDGTAWLRMYKSIKEVQDTPTSDDQTPGTHWEAVAAVAKLGADRATETVKTITAKKADWWTYAEAWEEQPTPTVAQRLDAVETALADIAEIMTGGAD